MSSSRFFGMDKSFIKLHKLLGKGKLHQAIMGFRRLWRGCYYCEMQNLYFTCYMHWNWSFFNKTLHNAVRFEGISDCCQ
jgi:hypothetical protein